MNNIGVYGLGVMGQSLARNIMPVSYPHLTRLSDFQKGVYGNGAAYIRTDGKQA